MREKAQLDQITRGMASRMAAGGVGAKIDKGAGTFNMTASGGFVPHFNKKEIAGALAGGYWPGKMKSIACIVPSAVWHISQQL